jgi:hypothetical protein
MSPWRYNSDGERYHPKVWRLVTSAGVIIASLALFTAGWAFNTIQSQRADAREDTRTALKSACQNLNHKIQQTRDPSQQKATALLIRVILRDEDPAVIAKYKRLTAATPQLARTNCERIVDRNLPK